MFKIGKLQQRMNPVTGQRFDAQEIARIPEKNPFVKKRLIEVVVVFEPATFTKPAVLKREIFCGDFMSVVGKAQKKYVGKNVTYRMIDTRPAWLKKEQEEAKA